MFANRKKELKWLKSEKLTNTDFLT
jgi:hypothetical protein